MTSPCPRCGTPRPANSPICQRCGLDFRSTAAPSLQAHRQLPPAPQAYQQPVQAPAAAAPAWNPTHVTLAGGMDFWAAPDGRQRPAGRLPGSVELVVDSSAGVWSQVRSANGWQGWVDGRQLSIKPGPPPVRRQVTPAGVTYGQAPAARPPAPMPPATYGRPPASTASTLVAVIAIGLVAILAVGLIVGAAANKVVNGGSTPQASSLPGTNPALDEPAQAVDLQAPRWDQVAAAPAPASGWKSYSSAGDGFTVSYPTGWTVVESPTGGAFRSVAFYPPGADPSLPSANIEFRFESGTAYTSGTSNISALGRNGFQIERPEGSLGSPGLFEIELPYVGNTGTLAISVNQDLSLKGVLKAMLATARWTK